MPLGQAVVLGFAALMLFCIKKAGEVAIQNEYASWAPALARLWVSVAGFVCPSRRDQWRADVLYIQKQGGSGLYEAGCHLTGAFVLVVRAVPVGLRSRLRGSWTKKAPTGTFVMVDENVRVMLANKLMMINDMGVGMDEAELDYIVKGQDGLRFVEVKSSTSLPPGSPE